MRKLLIPLLALLGACAARPLPIPPPQPVEEPRAVPPGIRPLALEQAEDAG